MPIQDPLLFVRAAVILGFIYYGTNTAFALANYLFQ